MSRLLIVTALVMFVLELPPAVEGGNSMPQGKRLSRSETEALVRKDLASRLRLPEEDITVVEAADRTWPDEDLGCGARKGMKEPSRVEGFAFTLASGDQRFVYHTDRFGRFRRCDAVKPIDPIRR